MGKKILATSFQSWKGIIHIRRSCIISLLKLRWIGSAKKLDHQTAPNKIGIVSRLLLKSSIFPIISWFLRVTVLRLSKGTNCLLGSKELLVVIKWFKNRLLNGFCLSEVSKNR